MWLCDEEEWGGESEQRLGQEEEDEECQGGDVILALQHTTQGYSELTAMQSHCRLRLGVTMRATG